MSTTQYPVPPANLGLGSQICPSPEQIELFGKYQRAAMLKFTPLEPLEPGRSINIPWIVPRVKADATINHLAEAKTDQERKSILDKLHPSVLKDPEQMLKIIDKAPQALCYASPEITTFNFLTKAVAQNHRTYDLLPLELQQHDDIVAAYRQSVFRHYDLHKTYDKCVPIFQIHPNYPLEKLVTPELYKEITKQLLAGDGITTTSLLGGAADKILAVNIGASHAALAVMRDLAPHLTEEFDKAEKEAIQEAKEKLPQIMSKGHSKTAQIWTDVMKKHFPEADKILAEARIRGDLQRITDGALLPTPQAVDDLIAKYPEHILKEYFDLENKTFLPTHPLVQQELDATQKLAEAMRKNPNANFDTEIAQVLEKGPWQAHKDILPLEEYIERRAKEIFLSAHLELTQPLATTPSGIITEEKSQAVAVAQGDRDRLEKAITLSEYAPIYDKVQTDLRDARNNRTPQQKEMADVQQWMFQNPRGTLALDKAAAALAMQSSPADRASHLDIEGYISRRLDWAMQAPQVPRNTQEIDSFKNMMLSNPAIKEIYANTIEKKGIADPEKWLTTPQSKFQFSMDTAPKNPQTQDAFSRSQAIQQDQDSFTRGE